MKKHYLLLSAMAFSVFAYSQIPFAILDNNNISARVNAESDLFWDPGTGSGGASSYEVPKGGGIHAIYAGNVWMGGLAPDNQLHLAAEAYGSSNGSTDYFAGPLADTYNASYDSKYNRVWKITQAEIDNHIANYNQGSYVMPEVITNWPAQGNVANGEVADLALFVDFNNNNIYDPSSGDYPIIRGDVAVYTIFNDARAVHGSTGAASLGVEVHCMVYSFSGTTNINNTVFINYNVFNRSTTDYHDFYLGNWFDFDLGDATDDFVGSDPSRNLFYCYNGDNADGDGIGSGYGANPPAIGCVFLSTALNAFAYYNNGLDTILGDPIIGADFYNYLRGQWKNDDQFVEGGGGHANNGGETTPTKFMFNGDVVNSTGWTETTAANSPGDRRGLGSVGPFNLPRTASLCIDLALVYASSGASNIASVGSLQLAVDEVQVFYDAANFVCNEVEVDLYSFSSSNTVECTGLTVTFNNNSIGAADSYNWEFPGGSPGSFIGNNPPTITYDSIGEFDVVMTAHFPNDSLVITKSGLVKILNPVTPSVDGIQITYLDSCPGGDIQLSPINAVNIGNGASFYYTLELANTITVLANSFNPNPVVSGVQSGDRIALQVNPVAGCFYASTLDTTSIIADFPVVFDEIDLQVNPDNITCISPSNATYEWFYINGANSVFPISAQQTNVLSPTINNGRYFLKVTLNESPYCEAYSDTLVFKNTVGIDELSVNSTFAVYPNPAKESINILCDKSQYGTIELFDVTGKLVYNGLVNNSNTVIPVEQLQSGVYTIQLSNDNYTSQQRLIIE
jgi:PKD repeat protein